MGLALCTRTRWSCRRGDGSDGHLQGPLELGLCLLDISFLGVWKGCSHSQQQVAGSPALSRSTV